MPGDWIDAHCHLADPRFAGTLDEVIERSRAAGVVGWIQGGVGPDDWQRQRKLVERFGGAVHPTFGIHPWWAARHSDTEIDDALTRLDDELGGAVALGELGIDAHPRWKALPGSMERQERAFDRQLTLAQSRGALLILHVVRAHHKVLAALRSRRPWAGGLVHSFAGTHDEACSYIELGFCLSISGAFLEDPKRRAVLSHLESDKIVIETDAPDQLPAGAVGPLNQPANLPKIAASLAPLWGLCGEELLDRSRQTLARIGLV